LSDMSRQSNTTIKQLISLLLQNETAVALHVLVQQTTAIVYFSQLPKVQVAIKMEVVNIMLNFPVKDCHLRAATMKAIAKHQKRHNVPCFLRTIYHLLERHANGKIIPGQFIGVGRPPSVSDADMKQMAQSLEVELGKTYTGSDVELMIKKSKQKMWR
jgi:hypothetical protein